MERKSDLDFIKNEEEKEVCASFLSEIEDYEEYERVLRQMRRALA